MLEAREVPAHLSFLGGALSYTGGLGVANDLQVSYDSSSRLYTFSDVEKITVSGRVDLDSDPFRVVCSDVGVTQLHVSVADRNDTVRLLSTGHPTTVNLGDGDDWMDVGSYYDEGSGYTEVTLNGIRAPVSVRGQGGTDTLWLNDYGRDASGRFGDRTFNVTQNRVSRDGIADISYDTQLESLRLNAGWGNDTVNVLATSPATPLIVSLKAGGRDVVNVGSPNHTLDTIQGPVDVLGEVSPSTKQAVDFLVINDQKDADANTYTLTTEYFTRSDFSFPLVKGTIRRSGAAPITYWNGLEKLVLNAGLGSDTINVQGTACLAPLTVHAGAGHDTITVGFKGSVADIRCAPHIDGGLGDDIIRIDDSADGPDAFSIDASGTVKRNGITLLTFSDIWGFDIRP